MRVLARIIVFFVLLTIFRNPVYAAPTISSISVSVTSSTATITWTTDVDASTAVNFGTSDDYTDSSSNSTVSTSHSIALSSLAASTTYHYQIESVDGEGETSVSNDATFTTSSASSSSPTSTPTHTPAPTNTPTPTPDRVPPSTTVTTDFSKPFSSAPTIVGSCSDISGVTTISYSLDNGLSWLPVDEMKTPGTAKTAFSFTPLGLEDGNYNIKIQASDAKGNKGTSKAYILIIDRLPPMVGTHLVHLGPQILFPTGNDPLTILSSQPHKITLSAVGGPLEVSLHAYDAHEPSSSARLIPLTKNLTTNFWSGSLNIATPGAYRLFTKTYDGAGHATTRMLGPLQVIPSGSITNGTAAIPGAVVSLLLRNPDTSRLTLWDGTAWGQTNPQTVGPNGEYAFIAPPGTYVLKAEAAGYITQKSPFFTITHDQPITTPIILRPQRTLRIGPWQLRLPPYSETKTLAPPASATVPEKDLSDSEQALVGQELPPMHLLLDGEPMTDLSLRGTPTILSFLTTWSPVTSQQLQVLETLPASKGLQVVAIFPQESNHSIDLYKKRGNYTIPMAADPDGTLVEPLQLHLLPTHIILDRRGQITTIKVGVLKKEELLEFMVQ